jgi:DNA-binding CsgD family transcriptional regulator
MITDDLIGQIYEAGAIPELWPAVLDRIALLNGSIGGQLFVSNSVYSGWIASEPIRPIFTDFIESGWAARNPRPARAIACDRTGFVDDFDLFSEEEMNSDPTYQYMRSKGVGWCTGTTIAVPSGDILVFSWERRFHEGPFDRSVVRAQDPLRPHLARASLIAGRLALERARNAAEALGSIGLPAAVLSRSQRLTFMNDLFGAMVPCVIQDRRERVAFVDTKADGLLGDALRCLKTSSSEARSSIPVRATEMTPAFIAHLVPIVGAANDIFSSASSLMVITGVTAAGSPSAAIIKGLFDLSPAEAKIATKIVNGCTVGQIAGETGVAAGTIRKQLKSIFAKTGAARQADLVRMLQGSALPH